MQYKYDIYDIPEELNPKDEAEVHEMVHHLLSLSLNEIEFNAAKQLCEAYFKSKNTIIKRLSILCVGHIARVYKKLVEPFMIEDIKKIGSNPNDEFYGVANDALDDIESYVDQNIRTSSIYPNVGR